MKDVHWHYFIFLQHFIKKLYRVFVSFLTRLLLKACWFKQILLCSFLPQSFVPTVETFNTTRNADMCTFTWRLCNVITWWECFSNQSTSTLKTCVKTFPIYSGFFLNFHECLYTVNTFGLCILVLIFKIKKISPGKSL